MRNNFEQKILEFISFYAAMGRATTLMEIKTRAPLPIETSLVSIFNSLEVLKQKKIIIERYGFYTLEEKSPLLDNRTNQDFLLDMKWKRLMERAKWFSYLPFVQFVLVSGSMSFGAIRKSSDFDIVLGVTHGRIFTARYLVSGLFSLFRARRLDDLEASSPDKFCFNHIITLESYEKPPHNYYRYELYKHIIPIFIEGDSYESFKQKNVWAHINDLNQEIFPIEKGNKIKKYLEVILNGKIGDLIETYIAKPIAQKRLSSYVDQKHNEGRVVISDNELEFHFQLNYEKEFSKFSIS